MYNGCATLGTTLYTLHTHKEKEWNEGYVTKQKI